MVASTQCLSFIGSEQLSMFEQVWWNSNPVYLVEGIDCWACLNTLHVKTSLVFSCLNRPNNTLKVATEEFHRSNYTNFIKLATNL